MLNHGIHILLLEDNPNDVELCLRALRRGGLSFEFKHVDSRSGFVL
jgi:hypothetical protein